MIVLPSLSISFHLLLFSHSIKVTAYEQQQGLPRQAEYPFPLIML